MTRALTLLGVPTTAGSHNAGQEKAPAALRAAGLVDALTAAGVDVHDAGDLAVRRHRPSPRVDGVRDLPRVLEMVAEVADRVAELRATGRRLLVLGGTAPSPSASSPGWPAPTTSGWPTSTGTPT